MNKREKEVLKVSLEDEKAVLKKIEDNYTKALADVKQKIKVLQADPGTQSKAYQLQFQKQLEKQISSSLDISLTESSSSFTLKSLFLIFLFKIESSVSISKNKSNK